MTTFDEMLAYYETFHDKIVEMYLNHEKTCEACKNRDLCEIETKCIDILEHIEEVHYKYGCKCVNHDKI